MVREGDESEHGREVDCCVLSTRARDESAMAKRFKPLRRAYPSIILDVPFELLQLVAGHVHILQAQSGEKDVSGSHGGTDGGDDKERTLPARTLR